MILRPQIEISYPLYIPKVWLVLVLLIICGQHTHSTNRANIICPLCFWFCYYEHQLLISFNLFKFLSNKRFGSLVLVLFGFFFFSFLLLIKAKICLAKKKKKGSRMCLLKRKKKVQIRLIFLFHLAPASFFMT